MNKELVKKRVTKKKFFKIQQRETKKNYEKKGFDVFRCPGGNTELHQGV